MFAKDVCAHARMTCQEGIPNATHVTVGGASTGNTTNRAGAERAEGDHAMWVHGFHEVAQVACAAGRQPWEG